MTVDSSALVAILLQEAENERLVEAISMAPTCVTGAPTLLETSILIQMRRGDDGARDLDLLVGRTGLVVLPFTEDHTRIARIAFKRFGKGRHKAALNFGDCMSYAVARHSGLPLLFKGRDFAATDIAAAPY